MRDSRASGVRGARRTEGRIEENRFGEKGGRRCLRRRGRGRRGSARAAVTKLRRPAVSRPQAARHEAQLRRLHSAVARKISQIFERPSTASEAARRPRKASYFSLPSSSSSLSSSNPHSLSAPGGKVVKFFDRTRQLLKRSPKTHQHSSSSSPPPSPTILNVPKTSYSLGDASRPVPADSQTVVMAFSFGASTSGGGANAQAELGPELPEVLTEVCREA